MSIVVKRLDASGIPFGYTEVGLGPGDARFALARSPISATAELLFLEAVK